LASFEKDYTNTVNKF